MQRTKALRSSLNMSLSSMALYGGIGFNVLHYLLWFIHSFSRDGQTDPRFSHPSNVRIFFQTTEYIATLFHNTAVFVCHTLALVNPPLKSCAPARLSQSSLLPRRMTICQNDKYPSRESRIFGQKGSRWPIRGFCVPGAGATCRWKAAFA